MPRELIVAHRFPWYWWWWPWRWWRRHSCWNCGFSSEHYDHHPSPCWANLFYSAPDLATLSATRFRPDFGPVFYRGRLDGTARLLVVGQDPSTDEQLSRRSFVGQSGQRLQRYLQKAGITRSYVMINTLHLGIVGQYDAEMVSISGMAALKDFRNGLMDAIKARSPLQAILTVGNAARDAVNMWPGAAGVTRVHIIHPGAPDHAAVLADWNAKLPSLVGAVSPDDPAAVDTTPYGTTFTSADTLDIPRRDLPFGTPPWHGTGGATRSNRISAKVLQWTAP